MTKSNIFATFFVLSICTITCTAQTAFAEKVEVVEDSKGEIQTVRKSEASQGTGKKAAQKFFSKESESSSRGLSTSATDHYLALHLGSFVSSDTYRWGADHTTDNGKLNVGVTYRVGEWVNSMDMLVRADIQSFDFPDVRPVKISLTPIISFPDSSSRFPLYFGAGAGVGIFFKQMTGKSSLALDYTLIAGARVFDIFENTGFFFEGGMKNSILLLSEGQFMGTYLAAGAVFTF